MDFNSLAFGRYGNAFQFIISKLNLESISLGTRRKIVTGLIPQNTSNQKSTLVSGMTWCPQATRHELTSMSYGMPYLYMDVISYPCLKLLVQLLSVNTRAPYDMYNSWIRTVPYIKIRRIRFQCCVTPFRSILFITWFSIVFPGMLRSTSKVSVM